MAAFKNEQRMIVIGSSWPKDEALLAQYINQSALDIKFVIAPHNIKAEQLQALQQSIFRKTVLFSEKEGKALADYQVFIIDTIGILTKIYSYADLAYVGGGFGQPGCTIYWSPLPLGFLLSWALIIPTLPKLRLWCTWRVVFRSRTPRSCKTLLINCLSMPISVMKRGIYAALLCK